MLTIDDAFTLLATGNRFAGARNEDKTLRTYIGQWRKGLLSRTKKQAMLQKYGFTEIQLPMFVAPAPDNHESSSPNPA